MRYTTNILEPSTLAEAAALMHEHASAGTRLAFVGGGTHMIGEPESGDTLLSTRRLKPDRRICPRRSDGYR